MNGINPTVFVLVTVKCLAYGESMEINILNMRMGDDKFFKTCYVQARRKSEEKSGAKAEYALGNV